MYSIPYFLWASSKLPSVYFLSSPLSTHVVSPVFRTPLIVSTNRIRFASLVILAPKMHAPTTNTTPAAFAVRTQCFVVFALFAIFFCLSACFSRSAFSPRSGGGSPVFFLSGCLPRPRVLPSGVAAGSARTLRSVLPLKAQAQPPVLLLCFLPLPLQLPIPLPPFSNPQPFFLPSSAPVSFSAVLLFLSFHLLPFLGIFHVVTALDFFSS